MDSPRHGSPSAAFRVYPSRCLGQVLDLELHRYCACGCLTCPHEGRRGAPRRQATFEGYGRTRHAFTGPEALGLESDLPAQVENWLSQVPRSERPAFVSVGLGAEPLPGFEASTAVLLQCLQRLLRAGVGISMRTRRNIPDPVLELLRAHADDVRVTVPLPLLDSQTLATWEPGTGSPNQRLFNVQRLRAARIPVGVLIKPLIPFVNDDRTALERLVNAVADTGVKQLSAAFLRLRPTVRRRLDEESPVSTRLIYGAYLDRQPEGDRPRLLPDPEVRRTAYRTLSQAASRRGLKLRLCQCADPDFGRDVCLYWPDDLRPAPAGATGGGSRQPPQKRAPERRGKSKGQVDQDDLLEE